MSNIDRIDQKIIFFLQQDGRLTNFELSEKVGLSPSPCLRRVKNLEQRGLISGYTEIIDEVSYGFPVTAFVSVRLENQTDQKLKSFEKEITSLDAVMDLSLIHI